MLQNDASARPLAALDWSRRTLHVTFDGHEVQRWDSLEELLRSPRMQSTPHSIVMENTFESWDPGLRKQNIQAARDQGHEIYMFRPTHTAKLRKAAGRNAQKSNHMDACVIYLLGKDELFQAYRAITPDTSWNAFAAETNKEYATLRYSGEKAALAEKAAALLGPLSDRDPSSQRVVCSKTGPAGYSASLLAPLMLAAEKGLGRHKMERLLGLHGAGHPSLLRSEVHRHLVVHARNRLICDPDIHGRRSSDFYRDTVAESEGANQLTAKEELASHGSKKELTVIRREIRRLYSDLRKAMADQQNGRGQEPAQD